MGFIEKGSGGYRARPVPGSAGPADVQDLFPELDEAIATSFVKCGATCCASVPRGSRLTN